MCPWQNSHVDKCNMNDGSFQRPVILSWVFARDIIFSVSQENGKDHQNKEKKTRIWLYLIKAILHDLLISAPSM